ncbi:hypothetical protein IWX90DRAFT_162960 [Phyllosticta citrichinensis]|uniref:Uncharacterized protein n=1 Tax=Phyllosticta citrichinensis TaxID=1130410 RepID=A0ABR1Y0S3_9PEZI
MREGVRGQRPKRGGRGWARCTRAEDGDGSLMWWRRFGEESESLLMVRGNDEMALVFSRQHTLFGVVPARGFDAVSGTLAPHHNRQHRHRRRRCSYRPARAGSPVFRLAAPLRTSSFWGSGEGNRPGPMNRASATSRADDDCPISRLWSAVQFMQRCIHRFSSRTITISRPESVCSVVPSPRPKSPSTRHPRRRTSSSYQGCRCPIPQRPGRWPSTLVAARLAGKAC